MIDIISKTPILTINKNLVGSIAIIGFVLFFLLIIGICIAEEYHRNDIATLFKGLVVSVAIITTIVCIVVISVSAVGSGRYKYQAHITGDVSMDVFQEKYTNISRDENGIWIFEDKEPSSPTTND